MREKVLNCKLGWGEEGAGQPPLYRGTVKDLAGGNHHKSSKLKGRWKNDSIAKRKGERIGVESLLNPESGREERGTFKGRKNGKGVVEELSTFRPGKRKALTGRDR